MTARDAHILLRTDGKSKGITTGQIVDGLKAEESTPERHRETDT